MATLDGVDVRSAPLCGVAYWNSSVVDNSLATIGSLVVMLATAVVIVQYARFYWARRRFVELVGQLTTPLSLWAMFGLGGLWLLAIPARDREVYSVPLSDGDVFFALLVVAIAGFAYAWAFRVGWSAFRSLRSSRPGVRQLPHVTWAAIAGVLVLDGVVRVWQIRLGIYYSWGRAEVVANNPGVIGSIAGQLSNAFWPFSVALLSLAIAMRWRPRLAGALLGVVVVLDLASGQRRRLLYVVLIIGLVFAVFRIKEITAKRFLVAAGVGLILFSVVFPVIQTSRREFRFVENANIAATPYTYVSGTLVQTALGLVGIGEDGTGGLDSGEAFADTAARLSGWTAYLSSIVSRMSTGYLPQGIAAAERSILLVVPGGGGSVDADAMVYAHFDMGSPGLDANGSAVADIFSQLHVIGVVLLFMGTGLFVGGFMRLLSRHGPYGTVLVIAGLPAMVSNGDSSAVYLSGLRNYVVVAVALLLLANVVDKRGTAYIPGEYLVDGNEVTEGNS